jgi:predicted nicotinamide N-methyase
VLSHPHECSMISPLSVRLGGVEFEYEMSRSRVTIGDTVLTVDTIASFDRAVDAMFEHLSARGQDQILSSHCPYFGTIWPSGVALANVVSKQSKDITANARILELGCGLAIPSLWLAANGFSVEAADCHPDVPAFLTRNMQLNALSGINYRECDWRSEVANDGRYDLIIASDVIYDRDLPSKLASYIDTHLVEGGRAIVADPGRPYLQDFVSAMQAKRFDAQTKIVDVNQSQGVQEIFVISFVRTANLMN